MHNHQPFRQEAGAVFLFLEIVMEQPKFFAKDWQLCFQNIILEILWF